MLPLFALVRFIVKFNCCKDVRSAIVAEHEIEMVSRHHVAETGIPRLFAAREQISSPDFERDEIVSSNR